MSVASDILKNFLLFVDGVGQAGKIEGLTLPNLELLLVEHRAGGMNAPIDIALGMNKLEASFTTSSFDAPTMKLFGLAEGNDVQFTVRATLESVGGGKTPVVVQMRGIFSKNETGELKPGEKTMKTYTVSLRYYKYQQGGEVIHEIDIPNMIQIVNGVDQLAEERANLGI